MALVTTADYHIEVFLPLSANKPIEEALSTSMTVDTLNGDLTTSWVEVVAADTFAQKNHSLVITNNSASLMFVCRGDEDEYICVLPNDSRVLRVMSAQSLKVRK